MKVKTKLITAMATAAIAIAGMFVISASADYYYGHYYEDNIPSVTIDYFDLPQHYYWGNDVGASKIHVTAPKEVKYSLSLWNRGFFGKTKLSTIEYPCSTNGLDGSCYWESLANNNNGIDAYISITRVDRLNNTTLGGYIQSRGRSWM